jgi:chromosomal replication initiation ATPase DnaA
MMSPYVMPGIRYVAKVITPEYITQRILDHFETDIIQVRRRSRKRTVVTIRAILCHYLYHKCNWSLQDVADFLRPAISNHTTVIHALRFVQDQLSLGHDNEIAEHIKNIGL